MDPFFFLTKHKNFIPHEYPCRTRLRRRASRQAARAGGRLHAVAQLAAVRLAAGRSVRLLVPPDRARHLGATHLIAETRRQGDAEARHLRRRDPVRQRREIGWMADYVRNLEAQREFEVDLDGRRERDRHLVRRPRRARRPLFLPARLCRRARRRRRRCRFRLARQSPPRSRRRSTTCISNSRPMGPARWRSSPTRHCRSRRTFRSTIAGDFMSTESLTLQTRAGSRRDAAVDRRHRKRCRPISAISR